MIITRKRQEEENDPMLLLVRVGSLCGWFFGLDIVDSLHGFPKE